MKMLFLACLNFLARVGILCILLSAPGEGQKLRRIDSNSNPADSLNQSKKDSLDLASSKLDSTVSDSTRNDSLSVDNLVNRKSVDTIHYSAEKIRYRNNRFLLNNDASLSFQGSTLEADSIVMIQDSSIITAHGHPLIRDKNNPPISGMQMKYNLKNKVGEVYYGSSKRDKQSFNGTEIRRQKDGDILLSRGDFSTCDEPVHEHYYFYSRRMILEPKSKVLSGPIVMNIADVPVGLVPMMVFPLQSGRHSGLLQPKFGGDQAQGFYINGLGYYWALSDYYDFKLSGDIVEGAKGTFSNTNINGEFRYRKRYVHSLDLGGKYFVSEFNPANSGWVLDFADDWQLSPDSRQSIKGNGRIQSSRSIVQDNAFSEQERLEQTANANLGYRKQFDWNNATFSLDAKQDYNLIDGRLIRQFPNLALSWSAPLFFREEDDWIEEPSETEEVLWWQKLSYNYSTNYSSYYRRVPGSTFAPGDTGLYSGYKDALSLFGKYSLLEYINVQPSVNVRQMWSLQSKGPGGKPYTAWDPAQGDLGDYFYFFNTQLNTDTRFYGIGYPKLGAWEGIRHTVTPQVGFTYAPELDSNPHFYPHPSLGERAYQEEQKTLTFGLGNDVDIKILRTDTVDEKGTNYKIFSLQSSSSYNFAKESRQWSTINSSFSSELIKNVPLNISFTHSVYDDFGVYGPADSLQPGLPVLMTWSTGWRQGVNLGGDLNSGLVVKRSPTLDFDRNPWSANFDYGINISSVRVSKQAFRQSRSHSASGGIKLKPTKNWDMSYDTDYDFSLGKFSRHNFGFSRVMHCWKMDFNWRPSGFSEGWDFKIYIIDLPDIKLETANSKALNQRRQ